MAGEVTTATDRPLKLMVLGNSDSAGLVLESPEDAWPSLLVRDLEAHVGRPVEFVHQRVMVHVPGVVDHVMQRVEAADPDVVILALTIYSFTVSMPELRLRQQNRSRMARWYVRAAHRTEQAGPLGRMARQVGQGLARRVIGGGTYGTYEGAVQGFSELIRRVSMREDCELLVLGAPHLSAAEQRRNPRIPRVARRFNDELRTLTLERHQTWVESEEAFALAGNRDALFVDAVHKTPRGHRALADAMLPELLKMPVVSLAAR